MSGMDDWRDRENQRMREHVPGEDSLSRLLQENKRLRSALANVQKIIAEAAMTGFNYKDGDWPERLFHSQQATSAALKACAITSTERHPSEIVEGSQS